MNVLLLGSGGREHAYALKISKSKLLKKLYIAPGNAGTLKHGENIDLSNSDFDAIAKFCVDKQIELVVVGPETPLVEGISDYFLNHEAVKNIPLVGPSKLGATLEGSKDFAKEFMFRHGVPTAAYQTFTPETVEEAKLFLDNLEAPYVLKADGLAAGKGVLILDNKEEAKKEIENILQSGKFGNAGNKLVIEEFLKGIELSVFVATDGKSYKILPAAKDYKRIGEGDTGLNTGGMGAFSPPPFATQNFIDKVEQNIVIPTIKGLEKDNIDYKGFVFIGLMKVDDEPFVIEYNVRMGDPETEVVFPRFESDLLEMLYKIGTQDLASYQLKIKSEKAMTVVLTSGGYPEDFEKGKEISGTDSALADNIIFHAGTKTKDGKILSNGGRVLTVTVFGDSVTECREKVYQQIETIRFDKMYFRRDIGLDLI